MITLDDSQEKPTKEVNYENLANDMQQFLSRMETTFAEGRRVDQEINAELASDNFDASGSEDEELDSEIESLDVVNSFDEQDTSDISEDDSDFSENDLNSIF